MATILAHIKIKEGKEARFEELEGELWRDTHENETNVRRYEFWRGAEKGSYYGLLSFNSYNGFIEHQASPHHEDSGLGEVIEGIQLEWIDPVPSASDLATTDTEPLFEGANDLQKQYHANFQPDVQDWWRALRAGA